MEPIFLLGAVLFMIAIICIAQSYIIHMLRRTIESQEDTIQRLVNREPLTYAETNTEPIKPIQESFSAWGNRMLTKEDMNQEP